MKIFHDGVIYVQIKDINYLKKMGQKIPESVLRKYKRKFTFFYGKVEGEYFVDFRDFDAIRFFEGFDYIVDFTEYNQKSIVELNALANDLLEKLIESNVNKIGERRYQDIEYKMNSIIQIIAIKRGTALLEIPYES